MIEVIKCKCGCGEELYKLDRYGRERGRINGHNNRKYNDKTQHKREWNHRNREFRYKIKLERGRKLKGKVVNLMGDACKDCGLMYDGKNACVFQFHHREPKNKEFLVNTRTLINYAWKRILLEIKKCDLMCANCHSIHHNGEY